MPKTATPNKRTHAPRSRRWTCAGCEVTVRYAAGSTGVPRRPEGWSKRGGQWLCLHCQREKAVEKATIGQNGDGWASRRQALLEFELRRSPNEPDGVIAKRANCSTGHVRKVRVEVVGRGKLGKAGELPVIGRSRPFASTESGRVPGEIDLPNRVLRRERGNQLERSSMGESVQP